MKTARRSGYRGSPMDASKAVVQCRHIPMQLRLWYIPMYE